MLSSALIHHRLVSLQRYRDAGLPAEEIENGASSIPGVPEGWPVALVTFLQSILTTAGGPAPQWAKSGPRPAGSFRVISGAAHGFRSKKSSPNAWWCGISDGFVGPDQRIDLLERIDGIAKKPDRLRPCPVAARGKRPCLQQPGAAECLKDSDRIAQVLKDARQPRPADPGSQRFGRIALLLPSDIREQQQQLGYPLELREPLDP